MNEYRELLASKLVDGKISAEDHTSLEDLREKLMMPIASRDYVLAEVQASTGASITRIWKLPIQLSSRKR